MASTTEACCEFAIAESNRRGGEQSSKDVQNVISAFQASMLAAINRRKEQEAEAQPEVRELINYSDDETPYHNDFNDILDEIVKKLPTGVTNLRMRCGEHHARPGSQTRPMCRQVQVASRKNCRKLMRLAPFRSEGVSRSLLPSFRPLQSNSGIGNVNREPALKENSNPILKNQLLRVQELLILKI